MTDPMPYREQKYTFSPEPDWYKRSLESEIQLVRLINKRLVHKKIALAILWLAMAVGAATYEAFWLTKGNVPASIFLLIVRCVGIALACVTANDAGLLHKDVANFTATLYRIKENLPLHGSDMDDIDILHCRLHRYEFTDDNNFTLMLIAKPGTITVIHDNATPENGRIRIEYDITNNKGTQRHRFWFKETFFLELIELGRFAIKPIDEEEDEAHEES